MLLALAGAAVGFQGSGPLIAVGAISHESNSFNPACTQLSDFRCETPGRQDLETRAAEHDVLSGVITGALAFLFESRAQRRRITTPELHLTYRAPRHACFQRN